MVCTGGAYLKVCVFLGKINYELGKVFVVHRVVVVQLGANLKKVKFWLWRVPITLTLVIICRL